MTGRLQGRIAIVTGAGCVGPGWGNGRATAVRFGEEGAKIFAVDRDLDSIKETVERVNPLVRPLFFTFILKAAATVFFEIVRAGSDGDVFVRKALA